MTPDEEQLLLNMIWLYINDTKRWKIALKICKLSEDWFWEAL